MDVHGAGSAYQYARDSCMSNSLFFLSVLRVAVAMTTSIGFPPLLGSVTDRATLLNYMVPPENGSDRCGGNTYSGAQSIVWTGAMDSIQPQRRVNLYNISVSKKGSTIHIFLRSGKRYGRRESPSILLF